MYQLGETVETATLGDDDLAELGFDPAYIRELERQAADMGLGLRIRLPKFVKKIGRGIGKAAKGVAKTAWKVGKVAVPVAAGGALAYVAGRKLVLPAAKRLFTRKPARPAPGVTPSVREPTAAELPAVTPPAEREPSPLQKLAAELKEQALRVAPEVAARIALPTPRVEPEPEAAPAAPTFTPREGAAAPGAAAPTVKEAGILGGAGGMLPLLLLGGVAAAVAFGGKRPARRAA